MKYLVTVNGDAHEVKLISKTGSQLSFELGGKVFTTNVEPMISFASAGSVAIAAAPSAAPKESGPVDGNIRAPMPGIVIDPSPRTVCSWRLLWAFNTPECGSDPFFPVSVVICTTSPIPILYGVGSISGGESFDQE